MDINSRYTFSAPQYSKPKTDVAFKSHRLLEVFTVPDYDTLKGFSYVLGNGQKVVIIPKPKAPISLSTVVKTGAFNEVDNKKRGISHLLEHMMFDGSKGLKPGEFDKIIESLGGEFNAGTNYHFTKYYFQVAGAKWEEFADSLKAYANLLKYPRLPRSQFKKEKEIVIKEIHQREDEPQRQCYDSMIKNLLGIKTNSPCLILGTEENIRNITRRDVLAYHRQAYTPDNMELYISGDINPEKTIKIIDKLFDTEDFCPSDKSLNFTEISPLNKTKIEFLSDPNVEASSIVLGFAGPKNSDIRETVSTQALVSILGLDETSRINKFLKKLDTEAFMGTDIISSNPSHPRILFIDMDVLPGQEQASLNCVKRAFKSLKTNPVTQDELNKVKGNMLYSFKKNNATSEELTGTLEDLGGLEVYKNITDIIKSLTRKDINGVANKYLNTKKASVSILQPSNKKNRNISFNGRLLNTKYITQKTLKNNLQLIVNDNPHLLFTSAKIQLVSPVVPKPGTVEVLARMLNSSSAKYSQEELVMKKAKRNLEIDFDSIPTGLLLDISTEKEHFPEALEIMKELICKPALNKANFKKIVKELKLEFDANPLMVEDRAFEEMYGNHPLGNSARKIKEVLKNVTFEDVQKYYSALMPNCTAHVVVTGPITSGENLLPVIESKFKSLGTFAPKKPPQKWSLKTPEKTVVAVQTEKGRKHSHICQLFHIEADNIEDIAALSVMDGILGLGATARLYKDLREKQKLAYETWSTFIQSTKIAAQMFGIKTDIESPEGSTNSIEKSLRSFKKHIDRMAKTSVTSEELARAKRSLHSEEVLSLESSEGQSAAILVKAHTKEKAEYYNLWAKAIQRVTPTDIKRVTRKYLYNRPSVISIITTKKGIQEAKEFLTNQGELKVF